jgi:hypothetical protein
VGSYSSGPVTSTQQTEAQRAAAMIRADGSVYFKAFSMQPEAFAVSASKEFDVLRNRSTIKQGMTDYAYMQALVRQSGLSKGKGPLNSVDTQDLSAITNVYKNAYLQGVDWQTWLEQYAQSPYASSNAGPTFSKEVSSALQMIDKTDAENILTKSYYETFGKMPTGGQIENFKTSFNAEAQRQLAQTTRTGTSSGSGTSSTSSTSKSITSGLGFTEGEQKDFIAKFLKDNYKITGQETSGRVKTIIDDIKRVYRDNLLPEPSLQELTAFAADAIGTGDETIFKQKIDTKIQGIRLSAGKFFPGANDLLTAGTDIAALADPMAKAFNSVLGTNLMSDDNRIKSMLNYFDGKTNRIMTAKEQQQYIESQPEFQTSDTGRQKYADLANIMERGLK